MPRKNAPPAVPAAESETAPAAEVVETVALPAAEASAYDGTLVSVREVPWMKIGKLVDKPMTAKKAAQQGGIDFGVAFCPVEYAGPDGKRRKMTNRLVAERTDTHAPLGIVSTIYKPLQYAEAFDFMDALGLPYVAAGGLGGGRQGFMVVQFAGADLVGGSDPHDLYGVLRTSHDCSRAIEFSVMPLRGRCMNQLVLNDFATGAPRRWSFKHIGDVKAKMAAAKTTMDLVLKYVPGLEETANRLADVKLDDEQAHHVLAWSLPNRPRREEVVTEITSLWHSSEAVGPDSVGTGWGLVNAVSEYFDWTRRGGNPQSRFVGALQGPTSAAVNRTAERVFALAA